MEHSPTDLKPILMNMANYSVYVGGNCHGSGPCAKQHKIAKVWVNDKYKYCSAFHDTAIAELEDDVSIKEIAPICVPYKDLPLDKALKAAGFRGSGKNIFARKMNEEKNPTLGPCVG
ncbi:hypothetical protein OSTOST_05565 [Ostertagia ostertagi]